ncbi:hypothetical protein AB5N19_11597 [Seiridium cardinale]
MHTHEGIWRKRQLVPCWIIQGISVCVLGVIASLLVGASTIVLTTGGGKDGFTWLGLGVDDLARVAIIVGSVLLAFCVLTLVFDITEAALYKRRRLSPTLLLAFSCIKTAMWITYLVFVVIAAAKGSPSALDLVLGIILVTTSISQVILGAIYTHKQRKGLLDRGKYADLGTNGRNTDNMASIPRSKTWRESIPAITVNSREWSKRGSEDTDYESFRNSLIEAEQRRETLQELEAAGEQLAAETRTLASSNYDASTWAATTPPQSPGLTTVLSHPPIKRTYSPADSTYDEFEQADLTLSGFYGSGVEGQTRSF